MIYSRGYCNVSNKNSRFNGIHQNLSELYQNLIKMINWERDIKLFSKKTKFNTRQWDLGKNDIERGVIIALETETNDGGCKIHNSQGIHVVFFLHDRCVGKESCSLVFFFNLGCESQVPSPNLIKGLLVNIFSQCFFGQS